MNDIAPSNTNSLVQKLKLLVSNVGAPETVKESLLGEIDTKGPTVEVMDRIIQALKTEADILSLTINSIENLKKQPTEDATFNTQQSTAPTTPNIPFTQIPTPQPVITQQIPAPQPVQQVIPPEPLTTTPVEPPAPKASTPVQPATSTKTNDDEELKKLLEELKRLQANNPNPAPTN